MVSLWGQFPLLNGKETGIWHNGWLTFWLFRCGNPVKKKERSNVKSLQNLFRYISITRKKFQAKYTIQLPMKHKNEEACISSHGLGVLSGKFGTICTWALKKWIQWPHVFRMVLFSFSVLFPLWCWRDVIYMLHGLGR